MAKPKKKKLRRDADDRFRATLELETRATVSGLVREFGPDVIETELAVGEDGAARGYHLTMLVTKKQARTLEKAGYALEVFENASSVGRERQKEVGRGDRFKGGQVVPRGRGRLIPSDVQGDR